MRLTAIVLAVVTGAAFLVGCSSSPDEPTPEQKKAFQGGPPPANYMDNIPKNAPANPAPGEGK